MHQRPPADYAGIKLAAAEDTHLHINRAVTMHKNCAYHAQKSLKVCRFFVRGVSAKKRAFNHLRGTLPFLQNIPNNRNSYQGLFSFPESMRLRL